MIWRFVKGGQQLRCEVVHADTPGHYCIVIAGTDRSRSVEEIQDPAALVERTVTVIGQLRDQGWQLR